MNTPFELTQDEQGRLHLKLPGQEEAADVRLRRAFPWSSPGQLISIRSSEGKELTLIEDLSELEASQRRLIENWLASHSFIPTITRIEDLILRFGYQQWKVETDHGPAEFRVQEREDIRFLPNHRFSVKDADGTVYELPALDKLDEESRKKLEGLL